MKPVINHKNERGGSVLEFALITGTLVPLMLGVGVLGVNMMRVQQTTQLAREAGWMFSHGIDLSQPGNQTILAAIGAPIGFSASGSSSSKIVLSAIIYVDKNECASAGAVDKDGNPTGACTNYQQWAFAQRLILGNSSLPSSNLSPLAGGPTGVTIDPTTGKIPVSDYATKSGAVAQFNLVNPYANVNQQVSGLPSRQFLYIAEAAATTFSMYPYSNMVSYSYGLF